MKAQYASLTKPNPPISAEEEQALLEAMFEASRARDEIRRGAREAVESPDRVHSAAGASEQNR